MVCSVKKMREKERKYDCVALFFLKKERVEQGKQSRSESWENVKRVVQKELIVMLKKSLYLLIC